MAWSHMVIIICKEYTHTRVHLTSIQPECKKNWKTSPAQTMFSKLNQDQFRQTLLVPYQLQEIYKPQHININSCSINKEYAWKYI